MVSPATMFHDGWCCRPWGYADSTKHICVGFQHMHGRGKEYLADIVYDHYVQPLLVGSLILRLRNMNAMAILCTSDTLHALLLQ